MAIIISSKEPRALLAAIKKATNAGEIQTWELDSDGDFTHSPKQWKHRAWFRASVGTGELVFRIIPPVKTHISRTVYAVYHGRFIEMLLTHFDTRFEDASATALPGRGDSVGE